MSTSRPIVRSVARSVRWLALVLAMAAGTNVQAGGGGVPGMSALIDGRIMVRLKDGVTLAQFIQDWEADHPEMTLAELDVIPSRRTHLLGVDAPPGTDFNLISAEIEVNYLDLLVWGEALYQNAAPEGHTGSVFVDGIGEDGFFGMQYARTTLGINDAHGLTRGAQTLVAVVDTGVDVAHPQLAPRIAAGGWDFVADDDDPDDTGDGVDNDADGQTDEMVGHGTFVAGLVNLTAPDAWILPIRALDSDGFGDNWILTRAIQHAIERGADVINLSLGSTYNSNGVNDAIEEAMTLGIVTVSAAGNLDRNEPEEYPAMRSTGFGVAATDHQDLKADFSNFDTKLFISAPGASTQVGGQYDPSLSIISTIPGGGYAVWAGTSMAAPFVSGAAALVRSQHPEWPCPPPPPEDGEPAPNCAYLGIESTRRRTARHRRERRHGSGGAEHR
jgi:subtilisin family serine protease